MNFQIILPEHVNQTVWLVDSIIGFTNKHTVFVRAEAFSGVVLILFAFCIGDNGIDSTAGRAKMIIAHKREVVNNEQKGRKGF